MALTIAGSDSGGGAGIQADLATFAAFGVFGTSAITAVTAQDTVTVHGITFIDPTAVATQVSVVLHDLPVVATKTGMLGQPETVVAVGRLAGEGRLPNLVVDPVLVTTSGVTLSSDQRAVVDAYRRHLLPHATVVTPNVAEATALTGVAIPAVTARGAVDAMASAGQALLALGAGMAVITGGHVDIEGATVPDVLVASGDVVVVLEGERVMTANDHGTGCTFSAAVVAGLAQGLTPASSIRQAKAYVADALAAAAHWHLGHGRGPVDHRVWGHRRPGSPGSGLAGR